MSAKQQQRNKEVQTSPLESNMAPALGEKADTSKKDTTEEKSIEESKSNSNCPTDKRPTADPQEKHSTCVAAPATPNPTAVPNPVPAPTAVTVASLTPAPTPLWKGIAGMISKTVSKVFGAPREAFGSESDNTGEPSKPLPAPTPAPAVVEALPSKNVTEFDSQDEKKELKRKRHEAARAYALGLGEDEKVYDASTVVVPKVPNTGEPSKPLPAPTPAPAVVEAPPSKNVTEFDSQDEKKELKRKRHEAARAYALGLGEDEKVYDASTVVVPKVPDQKPKGRVFASPRPSQPQTDAERHHAARAFALSVPSLPLSRKRRRDKEESSNDAHRRNYTGLKHPLSRRRTSKDIAWEDRLSELADYRKVHGHCNVPKNYTGNAKLFTWVTHQRSQYSLHLKGITSQITLPRIQALERLGFEWKPSSSRRRGITKKA
jgi:hypothetical protein